MVLEHFYKFNGKTSPINRLCKGEGTDPGVLLSMPSAQLKEGVLDFWHASIFEPYYGRGYQFASKREGPLDQVVMTWVEYNDKNGWEYNPSCGAEKGDSTVLLTDAYGVFSFRFEPTLPTTPGRLYRFPFLAEGRRAAVEDKIGGITFGYNGQKVLEQYARTRTVQDEVYSLVERNLESLSKIPDGIKTLMKQSADWQKKLFNLSSEDKERPKETKRLEEDIKRDSEDIRYAEYSEKCPGGISKRIILYDHGKRLVSLIEQI